MSDVGRYRIVRQLGRGGMAEVLEAIADGSSGFRRRVAIKRILGGHDIDPAFHRMFLDEARIASHLHHANVVGVLDYGVVDGLPFQVLEFVDGIDAKKLAQLAGDAKISLPVELALYIATEIAHGLDHAHTARDERGEPLGIVHRDLSPANILIAWTGDVKLTDFGVAFAKNKAEKTLAGSAKGTLAYMAPEQAFGGDIDGRADVFGLGCVLHRMLTGRSPLSGPEKLLQLMSGEELVLDASIPDDVSAVIARATRGDRMKRFESAAAMAEDLGRAMAKRLDRDAKTAMRAFLDPLRPAIAAPAQLGKLDSLLAVELVLASPEGSAVRSFASREVETVAEGRGSPPRGREPPQLSALESKVALEPTQPDRLSIAHDRVRTQRRAVLGLGALVVVLGGAWGFWRVVPGDAPKVDEPLFPSPRVDASIRPPEGGSYEPVAPTADRQSPQGPADASKDARPPPQPIVDAGTRDAAPVGTSDSGPPKPLADGGAPVTAFLMVVGPGLDRAEIYVDGARKGNAPKLLSLPVGPHVVELALPDGSRRGPSTVTLTPWNTATNPKTFP